MSNVFLTQTFQSEYAEMHLNMDFFSFAIAFLVGPHVLCASGL